MAIISNIKTFVIVALSAAAIWFYKDWRYKTEEVARVRHNAEQVRKQDSTRYSEQVLTKQELIQEMEYNRRDLLARLEKQDIKLKNIQRIVSTKKTYTDTVATSIILEGLLEAIEQKREITVPFKDSTDCIIIEGNLHFNGKDIKLNNLSKKFTSTTDIVAYLEKRSFWKFWKWFSKRKVSITVVDSCGKSETQIIDVKR